MTAVQINLQTTIGPIRGSGEIVFTEPLQTTLSTGSQVSGQGKLSILTATNWNLAQILDEGVSGIVAAINNKQYTMNLSSNTAIFSDTRAVYAGTSAAAVAAGVYTPAVAMNALGLGMGANRPSDGLWVNTVFISASTGAATFSGQVASGSTVTGNLQVATSGSISSGQTAFNTGTGFWMAYNSGTPQFSVGNGGSQSLAFDGAYTYINGTLASTVVTGAAGGATAMQATVANVLTGSGAVEYGNLVYNTTTGAYTSGSGTVISSNGIASMTSATNGFAITSAGNAVFSGTISASTINGGTINGTTGSFAGDLTSSTTYANVININDYLVVLGKSNFFGAAVFAQTNSVSGGATTAIAAEATVAGTTGISISSVASGAIGLSLQTSSGGLGMTTNAQITSTLATGTAPFSVASTTAVTNLNAQYWNGLTFNTPTTGAQTITLAANGPSSGARTIEWVPTVNASGTTTGWLAFIAA